MAYFYRETLCVSAVFAVARCPSVCLSRWCIVSTRLKISSDFFLGTVAPWFYFLTPGTDTQFQGEPFQRWRKIQGVRIFFGYFRLISPSISETERDRTMVAVIGSLTNGDIFNDLHELLIRFSRSRHFWSRISQEGTKLLEENNRKPYIIYRMVPLSMTEVISDPDFKVTTFFEVEYLKHGVSYAQSYYSTLIGNHTWRMEWHHVWWPWLTSKRVARL